MLGSANVSMNNTLKRASTRAGIVVFGAQRADRVLGERRMTGRLDAFAADVGDQEPAVLRIAAPGVDQVPADERFARGRGVSKPHRGPGQLHAVDPQRLLQRKDERLFALQRRSRLTA